MFVQDIPSGHSNKDFNWTVILIFINDVILFFDLVNVLVILHVMNVIYIKSVSIKKNYILMTSYSKTPYLQKVVNLILCILWHARRGTVSLSKLGAPGNWDKLPLVSLGYGWSWSNYRQLFPYSLECFYSSSFWLFSSSFDKIYLSTHLIIMQTSLLTLGSDVMDWCKDYILVYVVIS